MCVCVSMCLCVCLCVCVFKYSSDLPAISHRQHFDGREGAPEQLAHDLARGGVVLHHQHHLPRLTRWHGLRCAPPRRQCGRSQARPRGPGRRTWTLTSDNLDVFELWGGALEPTVTVTGVWSGGRDLVEDLVATSMTVDRRALLVEADDSGAKLGVADSVSRDRLVKARWAHAVVPTPGAERRPVAGCRICVCESACFFVFSVCVCVCVYMCV
jgi:hypothetical protein